jgi:hypothetical protein
MSGRLWRLGMIATAAGAFSGLFGVAGVVLANAVSERAPELSFAAVQLMFAWQLAKKAGLR